MKKTAVIENMKKLLAAMEGATGDEVADANIEKAFKEAFPGEAAAAPAVPAAPAQPQNADLAKVAATLAEINKRLKPQATPAAEGGASADVLKSVVETMGLLADQVEKLGKAPLPAKAVATVISKAADTTPEGQAPAGAEAIAKAAATGKPLDVMKAIHQNGGQVLPAGVN